MQKIQRQKIKFLPKTRLYLDQFWEITRLFKEHCKSVEVTVDRFRLEHCSEAGIQEIRERLRTPKVYFLRIASTGPTIYLYLDNKWRHSLDIANADDPKSLGLAEQIMKTLPSRPLLRLLFWVGYPLATITSLVVLVLQFVLQFTFPSAKQRTSFALLDIVAVLLMGVTCFFYLRPGPVLLLDKYSERKTVFAIHKYDLLKGAILLILGAFLYKSTAILFGRGL